MWSWYRTKLWTFSKAHQCVANLKHLLFYKGARKCLSLNSNFGEQNSEGTSQRGKLDESEILRFGAAWRKIRFAQTGKGGSATKFGKCEKMCACAFANCQNGKINSGSRVSKGSRRFAVKIAPRKSRNGIQTRNRNFHAFASIHAYHQVVVLY